MTRRRFVFDPPERFVAGAMGQPGDRTFFLQARDGGRVVSVMLEKTQVAVLAGRARRAGCRADSAPLDEPLEEAFRAGTLTLGWDGSSERVLIEARAMTEGDEEPDDEPGESADEDEDGPDLFRVRLSADAARAFVDRAIRVVQAGRLPCPLCGAPLDPAGHICPRRNGHYVN